MLNLQFWGAKSPNPVKMVILGWPSEDEKLRIPHNIIKEVMVNARKDVLVLRNRGIETIQKVLVPISGGPNTRLCLNLAASLAYEQEIKVTALHLTPEGLDEEKMEDADLYLQEIVENSLGAVPDWMEIKRQTGAIRQRGASSRPCRVGHYDLLIIGAGGDVFSHRSLFGLLNDILIETVDCSMLIARHYQPEAVTWLNKRIHQVEV